MTLQQLKYIITIANEGSLSKASEKEFVSQPSMSAMLKELENEIGIKLFNRTNRGLVITTQGVEFLAYARQVVEQFSLIENKYINKQVTKKIFNISTQHYSFAIKAFINMVNNQEFDMQKYEFAIRETKTHEVIDDVKYLKSEIGVLYLNDFNQTVISRFLKDYSLEFIELFKCNIYVYLHKDNPLAIEKTINFEDLQKYPNLSFEQGDFNSFYFAEEVFSTYDYSQKIRVNDRATMLNLMKGLNGYTLCSGIISQDLNGQDYTAIPLDCDEVMSIGYIKKINIPLSDLARKYIDEIIKIADIDLNYI